LRTFAGHTGGVVSVCLSADSRFALSGSVDGTLKLWEVATEKCLRTFAGHTNTVYSVWLGADSRFALSGCGNGTLKLWEVATGKCLRTFIGHTEVVNSVSLSVDSRFALSGSCDNTLKLWEIGGIKPYYLAPMQLSLVLITETSLSLNLTYEQELAQACREIKEENHVAAAQHLRKARAIAGYNRHPKAFNRWTDLYFCLPRKAYVRGWENTKFTVSCSVNSVCLSADSRFALSGCDDRTLKLWEVATGKCLRTFTQHIGRVYSVCLSADSRFALSGCDDRTLKLWEVRTGECLHTFIGHTEEVTSVSLSADSRFALSGSVDGTLKLWEVRTGKCLRTLIGHTEGVTSVCLSADSRFALSGSGFIYITGEEGGDGTLKLWEVATGKCLRTFIGNEGVNAVCLSADNRFALSGCVDGTLKLWEVATGKCLHTFSGHIGYVHSVCLSTDNRFALSGCGDGTLKLWEVATGKCLRTFIGHAGGVYSVCLSADNRFALSGNCDGSIRLWNLDWELEDRLLSDWDEGARPYLENFLVLHTPYAATLPTDRDLSESEIALSLTRSGIPSWPEEDFQNLLYTLGCAGYGWLRSEGVRQQLELTASEIHF
jgi:WD40 repeat protein